MTTATVPESWNALFLEWIQDSCKVYAATNTNLHQIYQKAYKSLKACPKEFSNPADLKELKFFGPSICKALEGKQLAYCGEHALAVPEPTSAPAAAPSARSSKRATAADSTDDAVRKQRKKQPWVPKFRSGGYAILLTLYHNDSINAGAGMNKSAIVRFAEALCDSSFKSNPNVGTFYSAWSSINTILKNDMAYAEGSRNSTYYITDEGRQLAEKLLQAERESRPPNPASDVIGDIQPRPVRETEFSTPARVERLRTGTTLVDDASPNTLVRNQIAQMAPGSTANGSSFAAGLEEGDMYGFEQWESGSYSIKVIIDNREVRNSDDRDFFPNELNKLGVSASVAPLSVGDCIWIAEHNRTKKVAVLNYILERKRLDDLVSSIKDGRFKEQKTRLKRSGLENIIYLVEEPQGMDQAAYASQIQTAMSETITIDNFFLKRTTSAEASAVYLAKVATYLESTVYKQTALMVVHPVLENTATYRQGLENARQIYKNQYRTKVVVAFDSFQSALSKSGMLTVRDIYVRMLLTVRGITLEKAQAIQRHYPTPSHLMNAYKAIVSEDSKKMLLFNKLGNEIDRQKVTKMLSTRVYEVWGCM